MYLKKNSELSFCNILTILTVHGFLVSLRAIQYGFNSYHCTVILILHKHYTFSLINAELFFKSASFSIRNEGHSDQRRVILKLFLCRKNHKEIYYIKTFISNTSEWFLWLLDNNTFLLRIYNNWLIAHEKGHLLFSSSQYQCPEAGWGWREVVEEWKRR